VDDPNAVEVDNEVEEGALFDVGFVENFVPVNVLEGEEAFGGWEVDEASLAWYKRKLT